MSDLKPLHQILTEELGNRSIEATPIPVAISNNLNPAYPLRPYQRKALQLFLNYWEENFAGKPRENHQLLFHMATGSGKTFMMAAIILYLYEKGYRNFLFFVNSTNIIEKTRDNFLNSHSTKYLFGNEITFGDKTVPLRAVSNFQETRDDEISIVFSTIQGLHLSLNTPSENSLTYDDFENKKIVLISDEAHHINVDTKKGAAGAQEELFEAVSWEGTVERIFKANPANALFEFTATVDFEDENLAAKYKPRLLYDYPLKEFRRDGYSKDVKVLQADLPLIDRALQAVLLSQYRRKVFERYGKRIKPVLLFKSKTIKESQEFLTQFKAAIQDLEAQTLAQIRSRSTDENLKKVFASFDAHNISLENLSAEIREDFSEDKLIAVNSKDESETKQIAVNSLEDESNEYRAVFAVDKLNEGWDVLNLFDIVRLYDTRDNKGGKTGKTTMSEAQLIGRGARYCPFRITPEQPLYERKFDKDLDNEMRICEELYYHSAYNPKYIRELNAALQEIGIKAKETIQRRLRLKDTFKGTAFYKAGHIFLNARRKFGRDEIDGLDHNLITKRHKVALKSGYSRSSNAFEPGAVEKSDGRERKDYYLKELGVSAIRKALQRIEFYEFENLRQFLPQLHSIHEFIHSDRYLGKIAIEVSGMPEQLKSFGPEEKLDIAVQVLLPLAEIIASDKVEFKGTKEFQPYMVKDVFSDKTLSFMLDEGDDKEFGRSMNDASETSYPLDLSKRNWYVFDDCFGTSEEKLLIQFIDKKHEALKARYSEVYLLRNEKHFKLYAFEDGAAFEPDFVLCLVGKEKKDTKHYQVFIEPKGAHLMKTDEWKGNFLVSIKSANEVEQLFENQEYVLWGLPFYNSVVKEREFEESFDQLLA